MVRTVEMIPDPSGVQNRATAALSGLLESMFRGEIGVGARLTEIGLAEKLGTSRTPVREALLELKGLGLVEVRRNCGAVFVGFSAEKLKEIYEVRRLLEVEATRKATPRMPPDALQNLLDATRALKKTGADDADWTLDQRLHATIAESSGNRTLVHEISRFARLVQAVRLTVGARIHVQRETTQQHLRLLNAMAQGDAEGAAQAMNRHLIQAERSAVAAIIEWAPDSVG